MSQKSSERERTARKKAEIWVSALCGDCLSLVSGDKVMKNGDPAAIVEQCGCTDYSVTEISSETVNMATLRSLARDRKFNSDRGPGMVQNAQRSGVQKLSAPNRPQGTRRLSQTEEDFFVGLTRNQTLAGAGGLLALWFLLSSGSPGSITASSTKHGSENSDGSWSCGHCDKTCQGKSALAGHLTAKDHPADSLSEAHDLL